MHHIFTTFRSMLWLLCLGLITSGCGFQPRQQDPTNLLENISVTNNAAIDFYIESPFAEHLQQYSNNQTAATYQVIIVSEQLKDEAVSLDKDLFQHQIELKKVIEVVVVLGANSKQQQFSATTIITNHPSQPSNFQQSKLQAEDHLNQQLARSLASLLRSLPSQQ